MVRFLFYYKSSKLKNVQLLKPFCIFKREYIFDKIFSEVKMEKKINVVESLNGVIKEGKAEILVTEKKVFYNPVQEFNRDLSIAVLSIFAKDKNDEDSALRETKAAEERLSNNPQGSETGNQDGITILEALSATGLRSIRYAKEIPHIKQIIANDISAQAVTTIKKNIVYNEVENLVTASHEDATMLMYQSRKNRFDAIDLDPYGCPSIFLDGAVQSVKNGGILLVTATDMAVLAGNSPETCYVKYGAVSIKSKACHELALRTLLQHIASHAGRYGRYIEPLLSISVDFYIRVFVRIRSGQLQCKDNTSKLGMVYQCTGCESMTIQPLGSKLNGSHKLLASPPVDQLCKFCKHKHHMGGPIWIGPLHDQPFVTRLVDAADNMELGTIKRIKGVLTVVQEELDIPLYYVLDRLMSIVRCFTPPMVKFRSALLHAGYNVSLSHANKLSIKTDAPTEVIWDVVRAWEKMHPAKRDRLTEGSSALAILSTKSTAEITFDVHPSANPTSRKLHMTRFQVNPAPNWGPGTRSTTMINSNESVTKKKKNQNKRSHKNSTHDHHGNDDSNQENRNSTTAESDAVQPPPKQPKTLHS